MTLRTDGGQDKEVTYQAMGISNSLPRSTHSADSALDNVEAYIIIMYPYYYNNTMPS